MASNFEIKGRPSRQDALDYHSSGRKGKIEVVPTKPVATSRDLSLAYSPGVAEPCLEIAQDPDLSFKYTIRGNLVGVISNGTAVLGLGDIGAYASKPVMEGKGVLFKKFADIDVFDIEVDAKDIDTFCKVVKALEPTFGGVNLEDVKSPECFIIERRLRSEMQIPVFHDDQHGTAIITGAALINALELAKKKISGVKVVFVGAGAAAVACAEQYVKLGVPRGNIFMCDKFGLVYRGRPEDMDEWKGVFAQGTEPRPLAQVARGADVMVGLSAKGVITRPLAVGRAAKSANWRLAGTPRPAWDGTTVSMSPPAGSSSLKAWSAAGSRVESEVRLGSL
jgi:malate dehydrogenase (oxaloacetate-decarboxylating)(NADP+)